MNWKVVARADNPDQQALSTLEELTGLGRGEVLLALRRSGLVASDGISEERARTLAGSLGAFGVECTVIPSSSEETDALSARFRVVLTGFRPGSRARLRERLQKLSGLPPEQVVLWLARIPFVLREDVDHETARRIRKALSDAGGFVELRPLKVPPGGAVLPAVQPAPARARRKAVEARPAATENGAGAEAGEGVRGSAVEEGPPPGAALEEPPMPRQTRWSRLPPPQIRFCAPGSSPPLPPVLPGADESRRIPAVSAVKPPRHSLQPPMPEKHVSIYIGRPPESGSGAVAAALSRVLELREEEVARLSRNYPAWVATFGSPEKRWEVAERLEQMSVTVLVSPGKPPAPPADPPAATGLLAWLGSDG